MKNSFNVASSSARTSTRMSQLIWTAAIFGIAILLLAIGLLQYRWNMQIRRATEIRVGADLESAMMKWHLDLYGELSTICIGLQVGPDSGANDQWDDYLRRYVEWKRAATSSTFVENIYSNPDVVSDIYIWETSHGTDPRLVRLDADTARIERSALPMELRPLLAHLQRNASNLRVALRAWEADAALANADSNAGQESSLAHKLRSTAITGWQFDESIPAIVHPIVHHGQKTIGARGPVDWFVIVLNRSTIEQRIFPELAQRYFGGRQGLEYKLAVLSVGKTSRILYSSDPGFGTADVSNSDSVMNIFGPPPESMEGSFWQSVKNKESLRGEEWHSFSGPVWFPVIQRTSEGAVWMLFLQHRTTPLQASITRVWRGNLIVGGAVLLLLATSMCLLVIATQRVRAVAALQMDFVASISHELRTPLAAMLSAGQNIADGYAPDLRRYGSIVTNQSRQLMDLVDQILLFAAMKDGKKEYAIEPLEIESILRTLQKSTLPLLEQQGFTVQVEVPKEIPAALGDSKGVLRCMRNLLENAAKYSGDQRWIGIRVELNEFASWGREVAISIADHGIGVDPDELERIFDPFYRGARVVAAQIHGSGLGLAVVRQIMNAIGGKLSVKSQQEKGSVFTLHLRVAGKPQSTTRQKAAEAIAST